MDDDFPYEVAYNAVFGMIKREPVPDSLLPMMFAVAVVDGAVYDIQFVPVYHLFSDPAGMDFSRLQDKIDSLLPFMPEFACLVVVAGVLTKRIAVKRGAPPPALTLRGDPDADEAVMVTLFSQRGKRVGALPIGPGRLPLYAPLIDCAAVIQRFGAGDPAPGSAVH